MSDEILKQFEAEMKAAEARLRANAERSKTNAYNALVTAMHPDAARTAVEAIIAASMIEGSFAAQPAVGALAKMIHAQGERIAALEAELKRLQQAQRVGF